jgi:hypothetical protein
MLRTAAIGLVSVIALGVSIASPAAAMGGHMGGGGGGGRGGAGNAGGSVMHGANAGPGGMMVRSNSSPGSAPGRFADHDMGRMRVGEDRDHGRDRDHDRDRRDRDHFRFFPSFAFAVDTFSNVYDPDFGCWQYHRVLTHAGWRLRRIWACY